MATPQQLQEMAPPPEDAQMSPGGQPAAPPGGQLAAPGQPVAPRQPAVNLDLGIGSVHDQFRGNVPQREEWLEVWADSTSTIGFRKQDSINEKRCLAQMERRKKCKMAPVTGPDKIQGRG